MHNVPHSEEAKQKMAEARRKNPTRYWSGKQRSWETKVKISKANQGGTPWNAGLTGFLPQQSDETVEKRRRALSGKKRPDDVKRKIAASHIGKKPSIESRKKMSESRLQYIRSLSLEENKEKIKNWMRTCRNRPTKPEQIVNELLSTLYPKEWKYVGDGQIIIGGKNPDFINVNGQKKIIEVYGDYWHRGQNPNDRKQLFRKFGFKTLVIWQRELKEIEKVGNRLRRFCK